MDSGRIRSPNINTPQIANSTVAAAISTEENPANKIDTKLIMAMFASLKVLGFANFLGLLNYISFAEKYNVELDARKRDIAISIQEMGIAADQTNTDWLLNLNEEDVGEIEKIVGTLKEKSQEFIYSLGVDPSSGNEIAIFHNEVLGWSLCKSRNINICDGQLDLVKQYTYSCERTTILNCSELAWLYKDNMDGVPLSQIRFWYHDAWIRIKIASAHKSKMVFNDYKERFCLLNYVRHQSKRSTFITNNPRFIIQLVVDIQRDALVYPRWPDLLFYQLEALEYFQTLVTHFPKIVRSNRPVLLNNSTSPIVNSPALDLFFKLPEMRTLLYEMLSVQDRCSLASTSPAFNRIHTDFCEANIKESDEVKDLIKVGFSKKQIFMRVEKNSRLRTIEKDFHIFNDRESETERFLHEKALDLWWGNKLIAKHFLEISREHFEIILKEPIYSLLREGKIKADTALFLCDLVLNKELTDAVLQQFSTPDSCRLSTPRSRYD